MFLLFILIVTPIDPAFAKQIAQSNSKPSQGQAHRSLGNDSYFQKNVEKAEKLLEELTLPTTEPPDIFDNNPSFLTKPESSNNYPSPNEKIFAYSSSVIEKLPSLQFGSKFTYAITNLPKYTYSSRTTGKMLNWPLDEGKGTWFTWITMFPTTTYATKSTRRTLGPDPLTASMTTQITSEETEYNPVKAWYEKQKTKTKYGRYTHLTAANAQDKTTIIKLQNAVKESSQNLTTITKNKPQPSTTLYTQSALPSSTPNAIRKSFTFNTDGILKLNQKKKKKSVRNKRRSQKNSPTVRRFYVPMIENLKTNASKKMAFNKSTKQPKRTSPQHKKVVKTRRPLKKKKSVSSNKSVKKRKVTTRYKSAIRDLKRIRNGQNKGKELKLRLPRPRVKPKTRQSTLKRPKDMSRGGKKPIRRILETVGWNKGATIYRGALGTCPECPAVKKDLIAVAFDYLMLHDQPKLAMSWKKLLVKKETLSSKKWVVGF
ncbi:unnamed protein product [Arctia plantaginis]|uniref:Uncharacterized protein n=1 Tax=Arctia plantaginis TaxID=874455 RepID=A0A8S1A056_ARCPL|nr:unnamed protein product [Arctia plantaginis]